MAIVCLAVLGIAALIGGCGTCAYLGSQLPERTGPVGVPSREVSGPAQAGQPPATQGAAAKESGTTQEAAAEKEFERAAGLSREGRYDLSAAALKAILTAYPESRAAEKARAILPSVEEKRVEAGQAEAAPSALPAAPKPGPDRPVPAGRNVQPTNTASDPANTLAYKLAVINAGGYVKEDHITVTRFAYLLRTIEPKTNNTAQQIADMSVAAVQALREKYGRDVKLLDFMEGMNRVLPTGKRLDYGPAAALYMQALKE
ncbi:MAG: hypothetical protein WBD05_03125 [Phycisphaerae bacterium]